MGFGSAGFTAWARDGWSLDLADEIDARASARDSFRVACVAASVRSCGSAHQHFSPFEGRTECTYTTMQRRQSAAVNTAVSRTTGLLVRGADPLLFMSRSSLSRQRPAASFGE